MKLYLYRKIFFFVLFLFLFSCQTSSVKQKKLLDGSQGKYKYELITPNNIKIYDSKTGNLLKEGRVQTDCPNNSCDQDKIKEISLPQIESFLQEKQGEWKEYSYKDRKQFLKRKGEYRENKKEGIWEEYIYKDRKQFLKRKGLYKENRKEGIWEEYTQKKTKGGKWNNVHLKNLKYENDKKNGRWEQLRENGQVLRAGTYRNGLKEDKEYKYSTDGKEIELKTYKNDKQNGEYWKKHRVCAEWEKKDTKKTKKKCKSYKYTTNQKYGFYKVGFKDGSWTDYYKDGVIKKKRIYREDKLNGSEKNYYPNGNLQSEGNNSNDLKIGVWKFYYPNRVKKTEGKYEYSSSKKKSLKVGIWKEYYSNGQLFAKGPRKHTQTGNWVFYFPNQQKAAEGEMTTEFIMSEGTIYRKDGKIVGKGKLQISIFKISPTPVGDQDFSKRKYKAGVSFPYYNSLAMKYRAGVPFTYYKEGKKYLEVQSNDIAIEYKKGKKVAEGPVISGSTKKNGCWSFVDGRKVYYINNKIKKGKIAKLQNCG